MSSSPQLPSDHFVTVCVTYELQVIPPLQLVWYVLTILSDFVSTVNRCSDQWVGTTGRDGSAAP